MVKYRFFVSYCRGDQQFASTVVSSLQENGYEVSWDVKIEGGTPFCEGIQKAIQRVHFFVPLMTPAAWKSIWVQQEIGYAIACNVPVVPIVFDPLPQKLAMIGQVQAIVLSEHISQRKLKGIIEKQNWSGILRQTQEKSTAVFQCDGDHRDKSKLIVSSAQDVAERFQSAKVMQRSTLTSFSLPMVLEDENWQLVHDRKKLFWLHLPERVALEKLGKRGGYDLIIDPCYSQTGYRWDIVKAKLQTLRKFLQDNAKNQDLRVVVRQFKRSESEIIIGDHWMAHSAAVSTMATERETISTWHAPTILSYYKKFQDEFQSMFKQQTKLMGEKTSIKYAVERIDCRLEKLKQLGSNCSGVFERCAECLFTSA